MTEVNFRSDSWVGNGSWEPFNGGAIAGGVGACDEDFVAPVMLGRVADIKTIKTMDGEGAALCRCLMNDNLGTRNGKWCSIKIKIAEQACVG